MSDFLTTIEEMNIEDFIKNPHLSYVIGTLQEKKRVSYTVLQRSEGDILLIDKSGLLIDSVFAGLTKKHVECIAKNGPEKYKKNLLKIINDKEMIKGVFEITKAMDDDLGGNMTKNQERVKNIIQYIKDNKIAFEF